MAWQKPKFIVMFDSEKLTIDHVYVGYSKKEAVHHFMHGCNIDMSYSDMKDEVNKVLSRYFIVELQPNQVSIRRRRI